MSKIEAIIVDGVRYDKVKTDVSPHKICDICDLHWLCKPIGSTFPVLECKVLSEHNEHWKRNEKSMEMKNNPSSAREFVNKMCVKSDKYAESLPWIMLFYRNYCKGKNEVPSTIKKMSRVLANMGFTSYRCSDGVYFGIEIKGNRPDTLIRDLDIQIPSKTKEEIEIPF